MISYAHLTSETQSQTYARRRHGEESEQMKVTYWGKDVVLK